MSKEPDYLAQNGERLTRDEMRAWFHDRAAEANKERDCMHFRYSIHETIPHLILIEGWKEWPGDQDEPRWQLTAD